MIVKYHGRSITACFDERNNAEMLLEALRVIFALSSLMLVVNVPFEFRDADND